MTALDSETARMLAESVAGIARGSGNVRAYHAQGWLHCALPETAGGLGFGPDAAALIAGGLARVCGAEPVTESYMAARLLALVAPESEPARALAEEARLVSLAEGAFVATAGRVTGTARHIAPAQEHLVVAGTGLYALPPGEVGPARLDGVAPMALSLHDVPAACLAEGPQVPAALRRVRAEGRLVLAAELLAHAETMQAITLEHLRTRQQFGQSLGQFQALQHKAVDLYGAVLLARAVLDAALVRAGGLGPDDLDRTACRVKARANDAAMAMARGAIQMFGALGITAESPLTPHINRTLTLVPRLGTSAALRRDYARLGRVLTHRKDTAA